MYIDYNNHYDDAYWQGQKTYKDALGREQTYKGPSLEWSGFQEIARILKKILRIGDHDTVLDIGCGGGDLVSRITKNGYGVEISQYAIDNCVPPMRGRIAKADITSAPYPLCGDKIVFPDPFDYVISTDLMEHIYESDLDHTFAWMRDRASKFMFLLIATVPENGTEFVHEKGKPVPPEHEVTAVSGHINVRKWLYWHKFFPRHNFAVRYDLMYRFQAEREQVPWFKEMVAWGHEYTWIVEKKTQEQP